MMAGSLRKTIAELRRLDAAVPPGNWFVYADPEVGDNVVRLVKTMRRALPALLDAAERSLSDGDLERSFPDLHGPISRQDAQRRAHASQAVDRRKPMPERSLIERLEALADYLKLDSVKLLARRQSGYELIRETIQTLKELAAGQKGEG